MAQTWDFAPIRPFSEALEWRTDIIGAREAEQRIALRAAPRRIIGASYLLDQAERAEAIARLRAGLDGSWTVDDWPLVQSDGTLPTATGQIVTQPQIARERRGRSRISLSFLLAPPETAESETSPYPSHDGADVVTTRTMQRSTIEEAVTLDAELVDNGFGPVAIEARRSYVAERQQIVQIARGFTARASLRAWLHGLRGRQASFWLPSWGGELALTGAASGTTMTVTAVGAAADLVGRHVMIDIDGSPLFREITAAVDAGGGAQTLTVASLGTTVPAATLVHLMIRARLDADRIELTHYDTWTEFAAPVVEVPE